MKNSRNSYNNTAATRTNAFFAKKLTAALAALCVLSALASATAVATGSVPCRAANRTALFERSTVVQGAVVQAEQSRQQRSELRAADAQKCMAFSASASQKNASGSISPSPSSDAAPGGSSFRLQWYHYAIAAGAILIMTIITFAGVKPAGKKQ